MSGAVSSITGPDRSPREALADLGETLRGLPFNDPRRGQIITMIRQLEEHIDLMPPEEESRA